jgi:hypothetical protein
MAGTSATRRPLPLLKNFYQGDLNLTSDLPEDVLRLNVAQVHLRALGLQKAIRCMYDVDGSGAGQQQHQALSSFAYKMLHSAQVPDFCTSSSWVSDDDKLVPAPRCASTAGGSSRRLRSSLRMSRIESALTSSSVMP